MIQIRSYPISLGIAAINVTRITILHTNSLHYYYKLLLLHGCYICQLDVHCNLDIFVSSKVETSQSDVMVNILTSG